MTYSAVYCALISKRLQNPLPQEEYGETHHIIPKSEGGTNDKDNLVRLSAREHYIAHLLLARIYDDYKMWNAIHWMSQMNEKHYTRITSRMYSTIKAQFSRKVSEFMRSEKNPFRGKPLREGTKRKISEAMRGKPHSEEHTRNFIEAMRGKTLSDEHKRKLSMSLQGERNGMFGKRRIFSKETKNKISTALRGRHWYNDGTTTVFAKECPEGFVRGKI